MTSSDDDSDYSTAFKPIQQRKKVTLNTKKQILSQRTTNVVKPAASSKKTKHIEYSRASSDSDEISDDEESDNETDAPKMIQRQQPKPTSTSKESNADRDLDAYEKPSSRFEVPFELPGVDEEPKIFVLVGSCNSGKSYMLKYMMLKFAQKKHFKFGLTFTSTKFTGGYNFLPDHSVLEFSMDYLETHIKSLRDKTEIGKKKYGDKWKLPHNFVIIDDCLGLVGGSSKDGQVGFFPCFCSTHRHTRTTIFILSQVLTAARSVSTVIRSNVSYAMMWPTAMENDLVGLHQSFGTMLKYAEFKKMLDECRKRQYSCLVFINDPRFTTVEQAYRRIAAPASFPDFELKF